MRFRGQSGSAILAAIFVVAIVAIITTAIYRIAHQSIQSALTAKEQQNNQFLLDSAILDAEQKLKNTVTLQQSMRFISHRDGHSIQVEIDSPQAQLNANAFSQIKSSELMAKTQSLSLFFQTIGLSHPAEAANGLIAFLNHSLATVGNSADLYEWPGKPMLIPSSLRTLPGISGKDYQILRHWVSVLPKDTAYIPQLEYAPVFLAYGLTVEDVDRIRKCLKKQGSQSLSTTLTQCKLADNSSSQALATLISDKTNYYFTVRAVLVLNDRTLQKTTLLYRKRKGNNNQWFIVWQHNNWNE